MMDDQVGIREKIEKVDHFSQQLVNSGYQWSQVREIVVCSLRSIVRGEKLRMKSGETRYRTGEQSLPMRIRNKLLEVTEWYKRDGEREKDDDELLEREEFKNKSWKGWRYSRKKNRRKRESKEKIKEKMEEEKRIGGETELKGILFVPHTEKSELAKQIREKLKALETVSSLRVKVIERTGEKIVDSLHKSNPWENVDCEREHCLFCGGEESKMRGKCKQRGVVYETRCMLCDPGGEERVEERERPREAHLTEKDKEKEEERSKDKVEKNEKK